MQKFNMTMTDKMAIWAALFPESITDEMRAQCLNMYQRYRREQPEVVALLEARKENDERATSLAAKPVPEWLGVMIEAKAFPVFSMIRYADSSALHFAVKDGRYVCAEEQVGFIGLIDLRTYRRPFQSSVPVAA